jgi:hypothetical protein
MWAHQYDQQVNQVAATVARRNWDNGPDANIFGLEPNFGCCTANMHQGWPKFVKSMVMGNPDGGLALITYGPCEAILHLPTGRVKLVEETNYPFDGKITLHLSLTTPANFPLILRIPAWASGAIVSTGDHLEYPQPGSFTGLKNHGRMERR